MSEGDLKAAALNSAEDFYDLLGVTPGATEAELRSAWRRRALKYHPDKVGANDKEAAEKFFLLQIALEVLSDEALRPLYDNARRARQEKQERDAAYEGRRRNLKEDLERRESAGFKRKRESAQEEEEAFERELKRLAADGARRRKEREEQLRRELREAFDQEQISSRLSQRSEFEHVAPVEENDRTIKFKYSTNVADMDEAEVRSRLGQFGRIQDVLLRRKKIKVDGKKHRREYNFAIVVYESIVGAHAAVTDIPRLAQAKNQSWTTFEDVTWATGKEPDCLQGPVKDEAPHSKTPSVTPFKAPVTPTVERIKGYQPALKKAPSFGSFRGTPKPPTGASGMDGVSASPTSEEFMMIRLKLAERKRLADQLKKEEEVEEAGEG